MMRSRLLFFLLVTTALGAIPAETIGLERLRGPALRGEALTNAADSMLRDIKLATWIRDGQSKKVMYVFFDPNCPYCRRVYDGLRPQVEFGELELRWVPVGILMETSPGKAAALLSAADPVAAFHDNENRFSTDRGTYGGIGEEPGPKPEIAERLSRNLALLRRSGRDGVPSLLYRDRSGTARFIRGAPPADALDAIVRDIGG